MNQDERVAELEDTLNLRDVRIRELIAERDNERALDADLREHLENAHAMIDDWIEAFDMTMNDKGEWCWRETLRQEHDDLLEKHHALLKDWNKFVPSYNAVVAPRFRNFGRPLAASPSQKADVIKRRGAGQSLRAIADETGLGLRTIRTITDKANGVDRATLKRLARIAPDKLAEAKERGRKRSRDALPGRISAMRKRGNDLLKTVKVLANIK
jgi:hypothetical protein